jgi:DNA processing protein
VQDPGGLADWIRLAQCAGVGPNTARKLLSAFGLPQQVFAAGLRSLGNVVPERVARALSAPPSAETLALIERTLAWAAQPDNHVLTLADHAYPKPLLEIADPPLMLYVKGRLDLLGSPSIAVVGSRNATAQGILNAETFSEALSQAGMTVVSGMALGIDTAAHQGALRGTGATVAVIGTGADIVYPARNRALAHQIAASGCIVSEYPLGMPAIAANFPRRNRIISGLARATLVVEAAIQSGSLITARMAAEQGRDVFAIPGSIHAPLSRGCHELIRQGATLVEAAQDILDDMRCMQLPHAARVAAPAISQERMAGDSDTLLQIMGYDPVDLDLLARRAGMAAAPLSAALLALELDGKIEMLAGGRCRRIA